MTTGQPVSWMFVNMFQAAGMNGRTRFTTGSTKTQQSELNNAKHVRKQVVQLWARTRSMASAATLCGTEARDLAHEPPFGQGLRGMPERHALVHSAPAESRTLSQFY